MKTLLLAGAAGARQLQVIAVAKTLQPVFQAGLGLLLVARQQGPSHIAVPPAGEGDEPLAALGGEPLPLQHGPAQVLSLLVTARDQQPQVGVAGAVLRQQHHAIGLVHLLLVAQPGIHADDGLDACGNCRAVELHQGKEVAVVGERHRRHPPLHHLLHQRLDAHHRIHHGVLGMEVEVDELGGHGISDGVDFCCCVPASPPSPFASAFIRRTLVLDLPCLRPRAEVRCPVTVNPAVSSPAQSSGGGFR
jgi:hypothetical protein